MKQIALLLVALSVPVSSLARDNGQWSNSTTYIREWFQSLMQPDNPAVSCCGEADAVEADNFEVSANGNYVAIITDGRGYVENGTKIEIPNSKMKWDKGNPTGHGILFLGTADKQGRRTIYCYVVPGGT